MQLLHSQNGVQSPGKNLIYGDLWTAELSRFLLFNLCTQALLLLLCTSYFLLQGLTASNSDTTGEDGSLQHTGQVRLNCLPKPDNSYCSRCHVSNQTCMRSLITITRRQLHTAKAFFCAGVSCCSNAAPIRDVRTQISIRSASYSSSQNTVM